jgi:hypothetical protein
VFHDLKPTYPVPCNFYRRNQETDNQSLPGLDTHSGKIDRRLGFELSVKTGTRLIGVRRIRPAMIVPSVTGLFVSLGCLGEVQVGHWQAANLLKPSVIKPVSLPLNRISSSRGSAFYPRLMQAALRQAIAAVLG